MTTIVGSLSEQQKRYVVDMGFGSSLNMKPYRLPFSKYLNYWLVSKIDTTKGTLDIGDREISIESSIKKLLGVPESGKEICLDKSTATATTSLYKLYTDKGQGLWAEDALKMLNDTVTDKKEFCILFLLIVDAYYLAPSSSRRIDRKLLTSLEDVDKIEEFNWCKYVAQILINNARKIKKNRKVKEKHGCMHLLHANF